MDRFVAFKHAVGHCTRPCSLIVDNMLALHNAKTGLLLLFIGMISYVVAAAGKTAHRAPAARALRADGQLYSACTTARATANVLHSRGHVAERLSLTAPAILSVAYVGSLRVLSFAG